MKTLSLLEQVQEKTRKNLSSTAKKNTCDMLHEILYVGKQELERDRIIGLMVFERLKMEFDGFEKQTELTDDQIKRIKSLEVTVKNGLDTAVCNGSTSSSYCSNPNYQDYELIKNGNKLSIIKKDKK